MIRERLSTAFRALVLLPWGSLGDRHAGGTLAALWHLPKQRAVLPETGKHRDV